MLVYGVADVSEDLWLARLFSKKAEVTPLEGAVACILTQTKFLSNVLSICSALLFLLLSKIFAAQRIPSRSTQKSCGNEPTGGPARRRVNFHHNSPRYTFPLVQGIKSFQRIGGRGAETSL